ncbi:hypothetical protein SS50377_24413 [Spironucleus salmonicida]|uniref:Uncharacterized protein n=1 Tax=Spironucleus salmonicida TaxID=348837 RepID=V6LMX2_9EUKA|nr:hypothetical protein SS50377_24413 [Spironucleus salmonicida]|eukprot:EST46037.1 Hypothetical protein SS50377_14025 [Spironucleus salmonicida]
MDKRQTEIQRFKQARIERLKALRNQEKEDKMQAAEKARDIQLQKQQELEQYKIQKEKQFLAQKYLNKLAYEHAYSNLPTAEDTAAAELHRRQVFIQQKSEKLFKAEQVCKENHKIAVMNLKEKYDEIQKNKNIKLQKKIELDQKEQERARKAVLRQRTIDEERKQYDIEQDLYENSINFKIMKAKGAKFTDIQKVPGIPIFQKDKIGFNGLEIVREYNPDYTEDDFLVADAYSEAQNFKQNIKVKEYKKFNVERMNQHHRVTSQAQEALDILEMIQKM